MAKPVEFEEQTQLLNPHPDDVDTVIPLPIHFDGVKTITSCWELSPAELAEVSRTGRIWLQAWGAPPPMAVRGLKPLE